MLNLTVCVVIKSNNESYIKYLQSISQYYDQLILITHSSNEDRVMPNEDSRVTYCYFENIGTSELNQALNKATGDWILWLHEGEQIDEQDVIRLRDWLYELRGEFGLVQVITSREKASSLFKHSDAAVPRLFRRRLRFKYYSPECDIVDFSELTEENQPIELCGVKIYGKLTMPTAMNKIKQLTFVHQHVEQKVIQQQAGLSLVYYQLAYEFFRWAKYKQALRYVNESITLLAKQGMLPPHYLYKLKYGCLVELHQKEDTIKGLKLIVQIFPDHSEFILYLALMYFKLEQYHKARHYFIKASKIGETNGLLVKKGSGSYLAHFYIGLCYEKENDIHQALHYYQQALLDNPGYNAAKKALVRFKVMSTV